MTESSFLWTTNGTGDGDAGGYTQVDTSLMMQIIAACCGHEGVAPGFWNELACAAGGANTVNVATGGALVDGKPYANNAPVAVNVPSAVGAGNTRIDRIVLRANWAAQTVRITRLAGVDAASPVAPTITQTSGTTYDVQLCRVLVDTSGAVTVTDERAWAAVGTSGIADEAVTGAKLGPGAVTGGRIASGTVSTINLVDLSITEAKIGAGAVTGAKIAADAVDDTKVGDRVPAFTRRQGGSATNWRTPGATTRTPGAVRMQAGSVSVPDTAGGTVPDTVVTFPVAFSDVPLVFVSQINEGTLITSKVLDVTASQMTLRATATAGGGPWSAEVHWLAIGPE